MVIGYFVLNNNTYIDENNPGAGLYGFGVVGEKVPDHFTEGGYWDSHTWEIVNSDNPLAIQFWTMPMSTVDFTMSFYGTSAGAAQGDGTPTPEPATLAVLGLGLAGLGTVARRRRK